MKFWKSLIVVLMTAAMVLACTACGGGSNAPAQTTAAEAVTEAQTETAAEVKEETTTPAAEVTTVEETTEAADPAKTIPGKYAATYDMKDLLNEQFKEAGFSMSSPVEAVYLLDLNTDNTFVLGFDGASFATSLTEAFEADAEDIVKSLLEAQGITEDQYDQLLTNAGYADFSELAAEMAEEMNASMSDEVIDELQESARTEGTYSVDGNKITLSVADSSLVADRGTINEDGSISISSPTSDGKLVDMTFVKTGEAEKKTEETTAAASSGLENIAPGVLIDDDIVKVEFVEFKEGTFGQEASFLVENKTDQGIGVQVNGFSLNSIMADPLILADIAAGETATVSMTFLPEDLEKLNITNLQTDAKHMQWTFHIYDSEKYNTLEDVNVSMGQPVELSEDDLEDADNVLVNDDVVVITYDGIEDSVLGPSLKFTIRNKTDKNIIVQADECLADGQELEGLMAADIGAGKKGSDTILFMDADLSSFKKMELTFSIHDSDSWDLLENVSADLEF